VTGQRKIEVALRDGLVKSFVSGAVRRRGTSGCGHEIRVPGGLCSKRRHRDC
jgi:hypothetical protein